VTKLLLLTLENALLWKPTHKHTETSYIKGRYTCCD